MKLRDIDVFIVGNPPPAGGGRYFIFVKLVTDTGLVGYGEVYAAAVGPRAMEVVIRDLFDRHLRGENPRTSSSCSAAAIPAASRSGPTRP